MSRRWRIPCEEVWRCNAAGCNLAERWNNTDTRSEWWCFTPCTCWVLEHSSASYKLTMDDTYQQLSRVNGVNIKLKLHDRGMLRISNLELVQYGMVFVVVMHRRLGVSLLGKVGGAISRDGVWDRVCTQRHGRQVIFSSHWHRTDVRSLSGSHRAIGSFCGHAGRVEPYRTNRHNQFSIKGLGVRSEVLGAIVVTSRMALCIFVSFCTSSTAQGGGGSFKNRKRIGDIDCCEWRMSEQKHWPTD